MSEALILPAHVGFIIDGNRRWARQHGLMTLKGHERGAEVLHDIALYAFEKGVKYGTAFVFSADNWSRTQEEVGYLMKLLIKTLEKYLKTFSEKGIRLVVIGRRTGLQKDVLEAIKRAEETTRHNQNGTFSLCFNYGGREEIADAARQLIADGLDQANITEDALRNALYAPEIPDVDLLVRTSGEKRLSGFMLYRAAYAELYFTDTLWPDFTVADFEVALTDYMQRQRRFGR